MLLDLNTALDQYGTLQSVQAALMELTKGIAWLQWNDGVISLPYPRKSNATSQSVAQPDSRAPVSTRKTASSRNHTHRATRRP